MFIRICILTIFFFAYYYIYKRRLVVFLLQMDIFQLSAYTLQSVFRNKEDAEDVLQNTFIKFMKNIEYIDKPGWKTQLSCMPGVGITWLWDSCFMTFITNYSNNTLSAFHNLDNIYRLQRKTDGFISMAYRAETDSEAYPRGRINPPIAAWAEWQHYLVTGDTSRLPSVIKVLEDFYNYIEHTHRRCCGLYWFEDSGSSGMDNSPRGGYAAQHLDGSDVCHIDLACQQALSAACISSIYSVLGNDEKVQFYMQEHTRICKLINRYHWSDKVGYYFDFFARSSAVLTFTPIFSRARFIFSTG